MELSEYLKHLYNYWKWLIVGMVIGSLALGSVAYFSADAYRANVAIFINRSAEGANAQYFTYEGYYAQQTAAQYAKTVLELLGTNEIISRAAEFAGLPTDDSSIMSFKGAVETEQNAPQLILVSVTMPERSQASDFAEGLSQAVANRSAELNQNGDQDLIIEQVDDHPTVVLVRPALWLYSAIGAALGLVAAVVATVLWVYIKSQRYAKKQA